MMREKIVQLIQRILPVVAYTTMGTSLQAKCAVRVERVLAQMERGLIRRAKAVKGMLLIQLFVELMTLRDNLTL